MVTWLLCQKTDEGRPGRRMKNHEEASGLNSTSSKMAMHGNTKSI